MTPEQIVAKVAAMTPADKLRFAAMLLDEHDAKYLRMVRAIAERVAGEIAVVLLRESL